MATNIFNTVMMPKVKSNVFDLSHDKKMSLNMGSLYPIFCAETVPGDKFRINSQAMLRFAPLIAPVMHKVNVFMHFFYVPNRILWPGFEEFITGGQDPNDVPAAPYFGYQGLSTRSLADYLGLPTDVIVDKFNALPFSAYQAIYSEYYRDQNLIDPIDYKLVDGSNDARFATDFNQLRKRAWQHDYFTASLPWAQKGDPVTLPLTGDAPVVLNDINTGENVQWTGIGTSSPDDWSVQAKKYPNGNADTLGELYADMSNVNSTTINDLRVAIKLQEWLEKNARGGSRYIESNLVHFGVRSSDARLQRPEYIGGTMSPMVISEVLQTSQSDETPQGNMAGHGISVSNGNSFSYYCEEHGYIIGIMSVMPTTAYQQGIPKHFSKFDRLDYYWPSFAHLGEQEVKNREIYYAGDGQNDATFGYVPRYAEYKYLPSSVAGEFRTSLDFWHMGRKFASRPYLNKSFIECDPGRRFFAVQDPSYDTIYAHIFHSIKAVRRMPKFGIPSF